MATNKLEKIAELDKEIEQIRNRQKALRLEHNKQVQKERVHRLCKRGGYMESIVPDSIPLSDELFKTFLDKTLRTSFANRILAELTAQNTEFASSVSDGAGVATGGDIPTEKSTDGSATDAAVPAKKTTDGARNANEKAGEATRVAG